jgi:starch synthase
VGGLADTVVDATPAALADGSATGFCFDAATPVALERCLRRAIAMKAQPAAWGGMVKTAMGQELSWHGPAQQYAQLYERLLAARSGASLG